ncbi:MAG: biotin/lipoyl-binding protein [Chitinophagales bacterium]|jgi:biotin carboxyl carrier protein|nr:biotin/lipoyl-binding protein [Chitinophagales bacterium]
MLEVKVNEAQAMQLEFKDGVPQVNGVDCPWDMQVVGDGQFHIIMGGRSYNATVLSLNKEEKTARIRVNANEYTVNVKDRFDLLLKQLGMDAKAGNKANDLKAPMPGLILRMMVEEGQEVKKGDSLCVLEAMKMENVLKAAGDGVVKKIVVKEKTTVEKGQLMIQMG